MRWSDWAQREDSMLIARQLCFGGDNMPRHQLDFTLERGQILLIQGRSGIGKTTLLNIIAGFLDADSGELAWQETIADKKYKGENTANNELDLRPLPPWDRPVSFLFQQGNFFDHLDCDTHLRLAFRPSARISANERAQITHTLQKLGIDGLENRMPDALSGGQAQRMALAQAILRGHPLILLDEPFSALDSVLRDDAAALISQLASEDGYCFLIVSHDPEDAKRFKVQRLHLEG